MQDKLWTISQRRALIVLCIALSVYIGVRYFLNRRYVSDPQPATPEFARDLQDKIDPNTADAPTLAVLPLIGDKRAADIVSYREQYLRDHPGKVAFEKLEDLGEIRGIGPSTLMQVKPYLMFPSFQPATKPSGVLEETPRGSP